MWKVPHSLPVLRSRLYLREQVRDQDAGERPGPPAELPSAPEKHGGYSGKEFVKMRPNPDRRGCPSFDTLEVFAWDLVTGDIAGDVCEHLLTGCRECLLDLKMLQYKSVLPLNRSWRNLLWNILQELGLGLDAEIGPGRDKAMKKPFDSRIRSSDIKFFNSPSAGHPQCLCSRCGEIIERNEIPVRCWPPNEVAEYRYHPTCYEFGGGD